jgi:hypothetical protein
VKAGSKRQISFAENYGFISDLALNANGDVYVVDSVKSQVYESRDNSEVFLPLGPRLEGVSSVVALAVDKRNRVFVLDKHNPGVVLLAPNGEPQKRLFKPGQDEGFLWFPNDICLNGDSQFIVSDYGNKRIQIFNALE